MSKLSDNYKKAIDAYLNEFSKRIGIELESELIQGVTYQFADYYFSFQDIMYFVDNHISDAALFEWYDYVLAYEGKQTVNFQNYLRGFRF